MYRVWYSTESHADYIIDHTLLSQRAVTKNKMYESDANNPRLFHTMPDHIRKILYLDAPDLIVEKDNEPIFSVEISTEAGTGHNAFQRFARIAASVENQVPAFYVYPEGAIIKRANSTRWDVINPAVFKALEAVMSIYDIPALWYYFPSDIRDYLNPYAADAPNIARKGLHFDGNIARYAACPDSQSDEMRSMFSAINEVVNKTEMCGIINGRAALLRSLTIRQRRDFMNNEFATKSNGKELSEMSPLSATQILPSEYLLNYLSQYESEDYRIGELLRRRENTVFYSVDSGFRGSHDPYPGCLAAIDYMVCREGKNYEERRNNLVLVMGKLNIGETARVLSVSSDKPLVIQSLCDFLKRSERHNLLTKDYADLQNHEVSRYFIQVRYGSTYSKVKHIRVYSYFADAILFPDGSLWRDA